jgi:hypothetical protein
LHLIVYTQKRLEPLIVKVPFAIMLALPVFVLLLAGLLVYLPFEAAELRRRSEELAARRQQLEQRISELRDEYGRLAAGDSTAAASYLLINLRAGAAPDTGGVWAVQVSSHRNLSDAQQEAARTAAEVARAVLIRRVALDNGIWYRVLLGQFESRQAAMAYADSVRRSGTIREFTLHRLPPGWEADTAFRKTPTN